MIERFDTQFANRIGAPDADSELLPLLNELAVQLAERVEAKTISAQDYALAKRFVSGLRYEITHGIPAAS